MRQTVAWATNSEANHVQTTSDHLSTCFHTGSMERPFPPGRSQLFQDSTYHMCGRTPLTAGRYSAVKPPMHITLMPLGLLCNCGLEIGIDSQ